MVAPTLVGALLVCDAGTDHEVNARLVEVEAYMGEDDPASHAHRGPTRRSSIMFAEPGHLYVYLSYGIHQCANVVCSPAGTASAVLLRAAIVERGAPTVRARRGEAVPTPRLLSGPGNLCRGLGIRLSDNDAGLCGDGRFRIETAASAVPVSSGPRVGITRAVERPLRFWWTNHPAVSRR